LTDPGKPKQASRNSSNGGVSSWEALGAGDELVNCLWTQRSASEGVFRAVVLQRIIILVTFIVASSMSSLRKENGVAPSLSLGKNKTGVPVEYV